MKATGARFAGCSVGSVVYDHCNPTMLTTPGKVVKNKCVQQTFLNGQKLSLLAQPR